MYKIIVDLSIRNKSRFSAIHSVEVRGNSGNGRGLDRSTPQLSPTSNSLLDCY